MYAIFDIETTGLRAGRDRITEIAIVLFDGKQITDRYSSLLNPGVRIPAGISEMTGITQDMLEEAPPFYEEARRIVELTEGAIFVAHNVRFDYSFVTAEFKRLGYSFRRKTLCTLKLMRKHFPELPSHSLGNLIRHFGIPVQNRHRALDDALAATELLKLILQKEDGPKDMLLRQHSKNSMLPSHWDSDYLHSLPEACGVYYMQDAEGKTVYVGKSINIRKRIMQHFNDKTVKAARMQQMVHSVHWEITGSELLALLLEAREIKRLSPPLNRAQRRKVYAKAIHLYRDAQGYMCLQITRLEMSQMAQKQSNSTETGTKDTSIRQHPDGLQIVAEFARSSDAKRFLQRAIDKYGLCPRLCQVEKGIGPCFHYQLKKCRGACCGKESPESYNARVQQALGYLANEAEETFTLIEPGRTEDERCLLLVRKGYPAGYAYLNPEEIDEALKQPEDYIKPLPLHPENRRILYRYLERS